ncbi:hypothetical protein WJX81_001220 [Elliptochloris bilobata]|uniref:Uncharacterized protein n=1 Tax=Elliptochloris bilobata TaxID=381761 RepID=A0AAW1RDN3_9CHLO
MGQQLGPKQNNPRPVPSLASVSSTSGRRRRRAQPVAELAAEAQDIKSRLASVPVYTVANKKNEFVLVSGDGESDAKQLGLLFFSEPDAEAMVEKIREQNPKLAKQSRVLKVTVDKVYDFAITPDGAGMPGANGASVIFRFMPDAKEVQSALELYREAGIAVGGFAGVPVFQAEGLTVKTERARYTPLFLARADLDAAVGNAYKKKGGEREAGASAEVAAAAEADQRAQAALAAAEGKDRRAQQAEATEAALSLAKAEGRLRALRAEGLPKVEVGSLEEVIGKMQADSSGEWASVMFIPAGALAAPP